MAWEQARFDEAVVNAFGFHALQLGMPALAGLRANRMPHQWLAVDDAALASATQGRRGGNGEEIMRPALATSFTALPFVENSIDLVLLPHTLEFSADPHATLREVARVLVPEGRVVICNFNPTSLWGMRQQRARLYCRLGVGTPYLPEAGQFIGHWRLRDWLRLLAFEVDSIQFGCYRPAVRSQPWLQRWGWLDTLGSRWWPILGAAYCVAAVKRVQGVRLIGAAWKNAPAIANAPVSVANRHVHRHGDHPQQENT